MPIQRKLPLRSAGPKTSVLSMFAGCGGLDLGFLGGFEVQGEWFHERGFKILSLFLFGDQQLAKS
jgi:hypothetical protein